MRGAYSFGLETFELAYQGLFQHWNPKLLSSLEASISGLEQVRFFGFGNETSDEGSDEFFETDQLQYNVLPVLRYALSPQLDVFAGPRVTYSSTDDDDNTFLNQQRPYGVGDFGSLAVQGGFDFDTRDRTKLYGPGFRLRVQGSVFPEAWDVEETFGAVEGEVAGYIALSRRLLVALRVGGKNVFGTFPFQEAAYIGGNITVRGYDTNRFAGDASVFGNAELRFALGRASAYAFRAEYGLFIFSDVGRVFAEDGDSDKWHPSGGGGLSAATLDRSLLWSLTVARSEEKTALFFTANYSF
jgi:outer membrane protein assembly factor BamA